MKKLFAAVPVIGLMGIWLASACSNADQGGISGGTGKGGGNGTGAGGTTQTGGSNGTGTGGSETGGSNGTGTGGSVTGNGGATGAGGNATGGSNGTGTGGSETGGSTGSGGVVRDASTGGTGGAREAGAGTGGGGNDASTPPPADGGDLMAVAAPLNGKMLTGPCVVEETASVCHTVARNAACPGNADRALAGVLTTDRTVTLGGNPGQQYTITLHVQGVVESKQYPGGTDQEGALTSPRADGWIVGGTPTTNDNYNVYMLRVTNPGATAPINYYMNSLQTPGVSNHTTYGIDYLTGTRAATAFKVMGGATIRMVAGDSNCDMIKNCGPMENDGTVCSAPIVMSNMEPSAVSLNPTFNFTTPFNGQWLVMTVKNVTSP